MKTKTYFYNKNGIELVTYSDESTTEEIDATVDLLESENDEQIRVEIVDLDSKLDVTIQIDTMKEYQEKLRKKFNVIDCKKVSVECYTEWFMSLSSSRKNDCKICHGLVNKLQEQIARMKKEYCETTQDDTIYDN